MGLFKKKVKNQTENNQSPESNGSVSGDDVLLRALISGDLITKDMALSLPVVSKAVGKISNTFATVPFVLYKKTVVNGKRQIERMDDDPRVRLINDETGDTLDSFQFKKAICEDYLMGKGGYAYIKRKGNTIVSLHYVEEEQISFLTNNDPINKAYNICVAGWQYRPYNFLKLLRNTKNGHEGKGVTDEISRAIESAYAALLYTLKLTKTSGAKKGFITAEKKISKESKDALRTAWKKLYSDNSESIVVLDEGLNFKEASATPLEMQLNAIKQSLNNDINAAFGIEADDILFLKYTMNPIITAFEKALNRDALLEDEKGVYYWAADMEELFKVTLKERYEAYKIAKETGWIGLNEIRNKENLEEIPGLDVISMSLGSVLFDINSGKYFVPNTGTMLEGGES